MGVDCDSARRDRDLSSLAGGAVQLERSSGPRKSWRGPCRGAEAKAQGAMTRGGVVYIQCGAYTRCRPGDTIVKKGVAAFRKSPAAPPVLSVQLARACEAQRDRASGEASGEFAAKGLARGAGAVVPWAFCSRLSCTALCGIPARARTWWTKMCAGWAVVARFETVLTSFALFLFCLPCLFLSLSLGMRRS